MNNWPKSYDKRGIFLKLDFFFICKPASTAALKYYFYFITILKYLISFENLYSL